MHTHMKKVYIRLALCIALIGMAACTKPKDEVSKCYQPYTEQYADSALVHQLIVVKRTKGSDAVVYLLEKGDKKWHEKICCDAYIGKEGVGKTREGDMKTPLGDFGILTAFGILPNPGTSLPYVDVTDDVYCCGDSLYYNQLIYLSEHPHDCTDGEHLIDYVPEYNYGFFPDYNKECIVGKGSAIFFHCKGKKTYTAGCVAVDEDKLAEILRCVDAHARLIIIE